MQDHTDHPGQPSRPPLRTVRRMGDHAVTEPHSAFESTGPATSADYSAHAGAIRLYGPLLAGDPAELYRSIRSRFGSVAPVLLDGDVPAWFVAGYREVHLVTSNPQLFAR